MKLKLRRTPKFLLILFLMASFVTPLLATTKVLAAGEKYEFGDADKKTIIASGGIFKGNATFTLKSITSDPNNLHYYTDGELTTNDGGCPKRGFVITKNLKNINYAYGNGECDDLDRTISVAAYDGSSGGGDGTVDPNIPPGCPGGPAGPPAPGTICPDPADADTGPKSCEEIGEVLGWILCPIVKLFSNGLNFADTQIQRLLSVDTEKYDNKELKRVWANIRNISTSLLIIVMLVMVIGTAMNFEFVSAYTVKRALPRLAVAAIFMVLSWYICIFAIEVVNALGSGMLGLMTSPLGGAKSVNLASLFQPNAGGAAIQIGTVVFIGAAAATISGALGILASFLGSALLVIGIALLVLIIRQIAIVALVLFAPLAILAWVFPGNDRLWKLWRETFTKLLLMYPIIMALIGAGRIFAFTIGSFQNSAGSFEALANPILKLVAYVVPYLLIPFTFRAAGGVLGNLTGMINDRGKGAFDRLRKGRQTKYERTGRQVLQKRADWQNRLQSASSDRNRNALSRFALRQASRKVGGYNVMAADSARRAGVGKELRDQIDTGRDEEIRALTVDKKAADVGAMLAGPSADGHTYSVNGLRRENSDGTKEYKTLGGAWVSEGAVADGYKRWGNDTYAQQSALSYEMRKASSVTDSQELAKRYSGLAVGGWNMSDNQAGGAWIGAAFENQGTHLEYKHTNWEDGGMSAAKAKTFAEEVYEKKGSYPLAQMHANTIQKLGEAYDIAATDQVNGADTQRMVQAAAETFMSRYGGGGAGDPNDPATIAAAQQAQQAAIAQGANQQQAAAAYQQVVQTNTPGAAHVAEEVRKLAIKSGVYRPLTPPGDVLPQAPSPPIDRQN